jgi:hypothetical protein
MPTRSQWCTFAANTLEVFDDVSVINVSAFKIIEAVAASVYVFWKEYLVFGKLFDSIEFHVSILSEKKVGSGRSLY